MLDLHKLFLLAAMACISVSVSQCITRVQWGTTHALTATSADCQVANACIAGTIVQWALQHL